MAGYAASLNPSYGQNSQGQYDYNGMSNIPGMATNWYPSEMAAQAAWFQANPQYGTDPSTPTGTPNSSVTTPAAGSNGLMNQVNNAAMTGNGTQSTQNPLQPSYLPNPPTAQATTYNPASASTAGYNPQGYSAATATNSYDPAQATAELQQAAGVQDAQQQQGLSQMLAAQGISPGSSGAQAAYQNLSTNQAAALDPALAGVQQYAGGLDLQTSLANQSSQNAAGQFNAGAQNTGGQFNAGALNTANLANAGAQNTAGQYNASASNQMTLQNLQDLLQSQQFNAQAYNTAGQLGAGYQNQDWLAQLQAELGLQNTGLNTAGNLAGNQANQTVPVQPGFFQDLTGAASAAAPFSGSGGTATAPATTPSFTDAPYIL